MKLELERLFSMTMYKDKRIPLSKMSFSKDFVNTDRGDMYPVISRSDDCVEQVKCNHYIVQGTVERLLSGFFPYGNYAMHINSLEGKCGFWFQLAEDKVYAYAHRTIDKTYICFEKDEKIEKCELPVDAEFTLEISCRPGAFDVYVYIGDYPELITTFWCDAFDMSDEYSLFSSATVGVFISGQTQINDVQSYLDCGISQADIRPIRYENGEVMMEHGKIYLTASIRLRERMYQGVFSWIPGTAEMEMTGAIFYDSGNGRWGYDVAASVLYHRKEQQWYLWVCSFSNGHILGHAICPGEIRFGVNVVDIELMQKADEDSDITVFAGKEGDEDPDFFYDEAKNKWYMAICRLDDVTRAYRYVFFESDSPFSGYKYIGKGYEGAETGGSFVKIDGEQCFVCGNSFVDKSNYRVYTEEGMENPLFHYPDGGFRGWGSVIPVKLGTRTRYFWLTFDRHNGSHYNWSYGNIYCYERR